MGSKAGNITAKKGLKPRDSGANVNITSGAWLAVVQIGTPPPPQELELKMDLGSGAFVVLSTLEPTTGNRRLTYFVHRPTISIS